MAKWPNSANGFLGLLAAWQLLCHLGLIDESVLPSPLSLVDAASHLARTSAFWWDLASTLRTWSLGLLFACVVGSVAGLLIGLVPGAKSFTQSTIEFLRPIPSVALVPGLILVFGTGFQSVVILAAYAAFWQMLIQVIYGAGDVDSVARDTARSFRFGHAAYVRHIAVPTLLPYLFTGLRFAASVALVLTVTGEMVVGTPGIGKSIVIAQSANEVKEMYVLIALTGVLGIAVSAAFRLVETKALRWHVGMHAGDGARA